MLVNCQLQTWQRRGTFSFYPKKLMCTECVATQLLLTSTHKKKKRQRKGNNEYVELEIWSFDWTCLLYIT